MRWKALLMALLKPSMKSKEIYLKIQTQDEFRRYEHLRNTSETDWN